MDKDSHTTETINTNREDIKKFYFKELDYLLDRLKWYDNLRGTVLAICVTASLTLISISVANNQSIFMIVPITILLFFIIFDRRCRKSIISYFCCGFVILDNFKIQDQDTVFHIDCNPLSEEGRRIINQYNTLAERKKAIQTTKVINKGFFFYLPIIILIIELSGSFLWILFDLIKWFIELY